LVRNTCESDFSSGPARAAQLIAEALDILDADGECPDAAAYLDLGLNSLRKRLGDARRKRKRFPEDR
jgi:hypothetical protein